MDNDANPAVTRLTQIPPALLEDISGDSAAFLPALRVMSAVQLDELHNLRHTMTVPQRLDLAERMAKLAGLEKKQEQVQTAGTGYQLVINIGGAPADSFSGVTVEQVPDASI